MRVPQLIKFQNVDFKSKFLLFFLATFFIYFLDSVMGYYFPIAVSANVNSNLVLGIIISLSSFSGMICDLVFPQIFKGRSWKFMFMSGVLLSIAFPFLTNLGIVISSIIIFLIASLLWGVYFEFLSFGLNGFVISHERQENYSRFWSVVTLITGFGSIVAPIVGSFLFNSSVFVSSPVFLLIQVTGLIFTFILVYKSPDIHHREHFSKFESSYNFIKEFKYWEIIGARIWPVILLSLLLTGIDSVFATFGGVFGEEIFGFSGLGWVIIALYNFPDIIAASVMAYFQIKDHKKLISQFSTLFAGIFLVPIIFIQGDPVWIVLLVTISSTLLSVSWILNTAVISDLQKRAGYNEMHVNAINRATLCFGFIFGPIIAGLFADAVNFFVTFGLLGVVTIIVSIILIFTTPSKLRLPQKLMKKF